MKRAASDSQCSGDETQDDVLSDNKFDIAKKIKIANFGVKEKDAEYDWETTKHFKNEWLNQMKKTWKPVASY